MLALERERKVFSIKDGRCELLYAQIELPKILNTESGYERYFNRYYGKIADCAQKWAAAFSNDTILKDYNSLSQHEKKFKFRRYEYYISFRVEEKKPDIEEIKVSFIIERGKKILKKIEKADYWDTSYLLMMRSARKIKK